MIPDSAETWSDRGSFPCRFGWALNEDLQEQCVLQDVDTGKLFSTSQAMIGAIWPILVDDVSKKSKAGKKKI